MSSPAQSPVGPIERTFALIKPDAVDRAAEIEDIIVTEGFAILQVSFKCFYPPAD